MNMAFTAGCFFILQCIFLMDISVADPLIDVSPSEINLGITSTLDINCTFSPKDHPDMAAFISLVLSRANATGQSFEGLAAITQFTHDSVTVVTQENVSAIGVHSQTGESFLRLTWQNPTALQGGVYKCSALGVDMLGRNVEMTNITSVTVDKANLNDIFERLHQLEMHESSLRKQIQTLENDKLSSEQRIENLEKNIKTLENDRLSMIQVIENQENYTHTLENDKLSLEQRIQNLENYTQSLENNKTSMEKQIADLKRNITCNSHLEGTVATPTGAHVDFIGHYSKSHYYVSRYAFTDINNATDVCKSLGGQLAVIDDQDEFTAVKGFLSATSGFIDVFISGSDEKTEGKWVLSDSDIPLPFTSWASGTPRIDNKQNCLVLDWYNLWSMLDWLCHFNVPYDDIRFMCEV